MLNLTGQGYASARVDCQYVYRMSWPSMEFRARLETIAAVYERAFEALPWNLTYAEGEAYRTIADQMKKPGFTPFLCSHQGQTVGALWYDMPPLHEIEEEFGGAITQFARNMREAYRINTLLWEREMFVHPDFRGQGMATQLRRTFLEQVMLQWRQGTLILTRMRNDNQVIIAIAGKDGIGYSRTGIVEVR